MKNNIQVIAFDADDTLWVNENNFQAMEKKFCSLLEAYYSPTFISEELFKTEMRNLPLYGYGIKCVMLCMIETVNRIAKPELIPDLITQIIQFGQDIIHIPVELLDGVVSILNKLQDKYTLVLATKGDLLDQERKLERSGLRDLFKHVEIMSDKQPGNYQKLLTRIGCPAENFLMIGNSLKSDVVPVLALNGHAAHIPYAVTWLHERYEEQIVHPNYISLRSIHDILNHIKT